MKRLISVTLVLCMLLLCLAGCSTESTTPVPSDADITPASETPGAGDRQKEKIPLTLWFWGASDTQQEAMQKTLIDPFNEQHPDYNLTVEYRASVNKDISVALAANEGPDIVYESNPSLALTYINAGKYADLTAYSEKYGWKDRIVDAMYDSGTLDGKLYALPMGLNCLGIIYNQSVLDEHGWTVPTTQEELTQIMDEAIAAGLYGSVNGNSGWKYNIEDYSSLFLTSFAGPETIYQALTNQISFADERIVNAVETCADWYTKGYLCSDYLSLSWDDAAMLLSEGRAPFFFGPIKFMQFMMNYAVGDQADDFRFAPFPAADGSNYYAMGTTCVMAINANSQHKDVCAELLNTMVSLEFVSQMAEVWPGYWGIPLKDIGSLDTSSLTGLSKYYAEALIKACEEIGKGNFGYYCSSYMPTETYELITSIDSVWLQTMTAQQLMEKVDTTFEKEYSANMVPPVPKPGQKVS